MILVDTNIVSAMMRPIENQMVMIWLDKQFQSKLFLSSITVHEILYGLALSPSGKRTEALTKIFESQLVDIFGRRVLSFDLPAAERAAALAAKRKLSGFNVDLVDTQIAGIALANKAQLATRNVRHFEDAGIEMINPWDAV